MAADNLTQLFDFEGQFEVAAQAILTSAGILAFISQQPEQMPTLSTGVGFDLGPALDQLTDTLPTVPGWPANTAKPQEYFRYTGNLEFEVSCPRDDQGAQDPAVRTMLSQLRGMIRAAMMRIMEPFNATNLPFYEVSDIRPNATSNGYNGARNVDFSTLRFVITFAIRPTAWPAWTP